VVKFGMNWNSLMNKSMKIELQVVK
jgi:hypothetical protein